MIFRIFLIVLLANISACTIQTTAKSVVESAISAHGDLLNYTNLKNFKYKKTSFTVDPKGAVTDTLIQYFSLPSLRQTILETNDSLRIIFEDGAIRKSNNLPEKSTKYKRIIEGANFIFFQPFKLKDKGALIEYLGQKVFDFSDSSLDYIKVTYPNSTDIWYFFFDQKTRRVKANAVDHNGKISLILNDSLQWHKKLLVHSKRRSFLSNSNFDLIRLQASYEYKMLSIE